MDPQTKMMLITGLITFLSITVFYASILIIVIVYKYMKKKNNPIDITVMELTQSGVMARHEIGRVEFQEGKGWRVVTAKGLRKVKDNLGYNITDDDMEISKMGKARKFLLVVMKDGLTSPLRKALVSEEFTSEEKAVLNKCNEAFSKPGAIKLSDIPKSLSLEPVLQEQTRFRMDVAMDKIEISGQDPRKMARRMLLVSGGVFIFTILICFILFIVFIQQAPDAAIRVAGQGAQVATAAANTMPTTIPGLGGMMPG